ncbi:MAG: hypothetical protein AB7O80_14760 [Acetobacteraceae bacterium]
MIRTFVLAAALLTAGAARAEMPSWMPPGPGQEEVEVSCAVCHTLTYIKMNSRFMKPDVWKAEVAKMRTVFGAPIDDDTATTIVAYLNKNFGAP